ncbi:AbrB/MazE/SpoVT family DNA-binding domain-containing protein [Aurantimonas sp. VKM B-3413]|uniref:AbrB/MazE/SpoVT family DNA-binding domain-containing protein n=1 Tax=Aurantimonas sp. VKM B-3413 TaxID=2779401 RepID=UPI001E477DA9|nr:AbrB/MazE/SpoVT family DNA-binding domain-containing protein [Aurantimonas sp. VKM B-3413]MCB8838832.1 AbrB/MazE/SpoVT family DNA-binding domain-containing protein [Aurantimonas sp. VKM B-3413]
MNTVVRKIGNSEGVILPKEILEQAGLVTGDRLTAIVSEQEIRLVKADSDFDEELAHARTFMDKYRDALSKLAK